MKLILLLLSLNAFSTDLINEGDSSQKLISYLGQPTYKEASKQLENAEAWYYLAGTEECGYTVKDGTVQYHFCRRIKSEKELYAEEHKGRRMLGKILQGMGQGMMNANSAGSHCNSYRVGNSISTDCY